MVKTLSSRENNESHWDLFFRYNGIHYSEGLPMYYFRKLKIKYRYIMHRKLQKTCKSDETLKESRVAVIVFKSDRLSLKISPAVKQRRFHGILSMQCILIFHLCAHMHCWCSLFHWLQVVSESPQCCQRTDVCIRGGDKRCSCSPRRLRTEAFMR